jgi:phage terminase large subunit
MNDREKLKSLLIDLLEDAYFRKMSDKQIKELIQFLEALKLGVN